MEDKILDNSFLDLDDVKKALKAGGVNRFFEKGDGIIIEKSDEVKVKVTFNNNRLQVKPQFPQIGNLPQAVVTVLSFIFLGWFQVPYWGILPFVIGQVASFGIYYPQINRLRKEVGKILGQ